MMSGVAMLPLIPLNDTSESFEPSAEVVDRENGVALVGLDHYPAHPYLSVPTPTSGSSMGLDSMDEISDLVERGNFQDLSDGGADMLLGHPFGGEVPHAEELPEIDVLDAEMLSPANSTLSYQDGHYHPILDQEIPFYSSDISYEEEIPTQLAEEQHDAAYDGLIQAVAPNLPGSVSALPVVMSELTQQLQHIQEGQEHGDFISIPDAQNGALDNSTSPLPLFPQTTIDVGNVLNAPPQDFSSGLQQNEQSSALQGGGSVLVGLGGSILAYAEGLPVITQTHQFLHSDFTLPLLSFPSSDTNWVGETVASEADEIEVEDQYNLSLGEFLSAWGRTVLRNDEPRRRTRGPALPAVSRQRDLQDLDPVEVCDLQGDRCDIQRIDWTELGITRSEAREMRRQTYKNYTNLRVSHRPIRNTTIPRLLRNNDYFKFRRMDFRHDVHLSHFQLRNLVACASRDHVFYAGKSKVMRYSPMEGSGLSDAYSVAMDLTQPSVQPFYGVPGGAVQISTLTVAHNILVAGGFCGEYGITNLRASKTSRHTEGVLTDDANSITNHIQVHLSRGSSLPLAAFASNDKGLRIVDVNTNTLIAEHKYDHAINCSAISPDQRLRVLTGDTRKVLICNAETGETLQELEGHRDFGFACDWSDDGWTVATGNQDMQVLIWDARKWRNSRGESTPVTTIAAEMAGVRKLKFSPLGSGKRVLVAAEPADIVSVIDADTFSSKQDLTFFGEIGGLDFTNNGQELLIANCDSMRGGIMEYERCALASRASHDSGEARNSRRNGP